MKPDCKACDDTGFIGTRHEGGSYDHPPRQVKIPCPSCNPMETPRGKPNMTVERFPMQDKKGTKN